MNSRTGGHIYGLHRVVDADGALPQAAGRLDNRPPAYDNEVVIDVDTLNIDSASFHQIVADVGSHADAVGRRIESIVDERGKMQNPVTGSGGMLLGDVRAVGPVYEGSVAVGDSVATLVSLTVTPLELDSVDRVHMQADQVEVTGTAYLWPSSPLVAMPTDMPARLALALLDVCGAPAQTRRLVDGAARVLVVGMGKSGMLCAAAARDTLGRSGRVCGVDLDDTHLAAMGEAEIIDDFRCADAQRPADVLEVSRELSGGGLFDVVINTCNVPQTEMSAILACRDRGKVYFFNMATSFARAALGCEGVGKDVDLLIGNGYARDHAATTLDLVRRFPAVRRQIEHLL